MTHHVNSRIHWTDLPFEFLDNLEEYAKHNAICFNGIGQFDIGVNVMLGNYETLYDHFVHFGQTKMSKDDFVKEIKERVRPIHRSNRVTCVKKD